MLLKKSECNSFTRVICLIFLCFFIVPTRLVHAGYEDRVCIGGYFIVSSQSVGGTFHTHFDLREKEDKSGWEERVDWSSNPSYKFALGSGVRANCISPTMSVGNCFLFHAPNGHKISTQVEDFLQANVDIWVDTYTELMNLTIDDCPIPPTCPDNDGDGYNQCEDCDDSNATLTVQCISRDKPDLKQGCP